MALRASILFFAAEIREEVMMAHSSCASILNGSTSFSFIKPPSIINSIQYSLSSASSSTTPSRAMNSALDALDRTRDKLEPTDVPAQTNWFPIALPDAVFGNAATNLITRNANRLVRRLKSSSSINVLQGEVGHNQTY